MASEQDIAFPTLGPKELAALAARGHSRAVRAGEYLFRAGDRNSCFYVVVDGSIEILEQSDGEPRVVAVHGPGQFTGDVDMLTGRAAVVNARMAEDGHVLEMNTAELRRAVDELPDLGENILKAFLMRRELLLSQGFSVVKIIGSRAAGVAAGVGLPPARHPERSEGAMIQRLPPSLRSG
jgi:thioredoxin reductase (NADPH)